MSCESITCIHTKDRISDLPDDIILHILSFMDAKTSVRTGVLSKQFAYLWTEIPCLNFGLATVDFVYTTICFHKRHNLEKVSVTVCRKRKSDPDDKIKFRRFIRLLSLTSVKEFNLDFKGVHYKFPPHFYSNRSLEKLTLTDCHMKTNGLVNWKSLQSLSLDFMSLSNDTINDVLSGCPSLEFLELSRIWQCSQINLSNNKCLRKLVIDEYKEECTLEIVAPNLKSLLLLGGMNWFKCRVLNAKFLTYCVLDFFDDSEEPILFLLMEMLTSLLDDLSHVEVVTIGEWVLQVLYFLELSKLPCPMSKAIKCLEIHTNMTKDDMNGIACLLRNLNRLETLWIELYKYGKYSFLPWLSDKDLEKDKSYRTSENMQTKVDLKLKNLTVSFSADKQFHCDGVLFLAEFLLKNANFLENMTIRAVGSEHSLQKFASTLLKFPRSSRLAAYKRFRSVVGSVTGSFYFRKKIKLIMSVLLSTNLIQNVSEKVTKLLQ